MKSPKEEMRLAIKERLGYMNDRDRATESRVLCKELEQNIDENAKMIAGFYPLSDEPDLRELLLKWNSEGRIIAMPAMEQNALVYRVPASWDELEEGPYGILQPPRSSPVANDALLDIVIVPGRAFTRTGERLGRGNGGYDHWIEKQRVRNPATKYIGVCFDAQMMTTLPVEAHDEKMDMVITPRGVMKLET